MSARDKEEFYELCEQGSKRKLTEPEMQKLERLTSQLEKEEEANEQHRREQMGLLEFHGHERVVDVRGRL